MIIVINLFNQLFSHTAMAPISPIYHPAGTKAECRRAARLGKGTLYYLAAAVRSALFAVAPEFKMSLFFSFPFYFFTGEQTENSPPPSESVTALQNSPSVLYYWPHIPPSGRIRPDKVFLHPAVGHAHTVWGWEISRGQFDKAHPPSHNKTHAHKVHTHLYALHSASLNCSLPLSLPPADAHTDTNRRHAQTAQVWLSRNSRDCRKEHRAGLTHLFEIAAFLFKFTKRKSTTEINTLCSARNCGIVSTSCRSNEATGGYRTDGVHLFPKGHMKWPPPRTLKLHI